MTPKARASLNFQAPYRRPDDLIVYKVCPHCKVETTPFQLTCDGHPVEVHRCHEHGDVVPMRSHISNPRPEAR